VYITPQLAILWPPCPPITWPNVLHGRNIPHFTIILSRSIVDPLWLSIAQAHIFVLKRTTPQPRG